MREVERLALRNKRLHLRPRLALRGVGEEVHDDRAAVNGLLDREECLSRDPAVLNRLPPALAVLADTDNDVETVVPRIEALAMPLRAVADESEGVVLEVILELGQRPVGALVHLLLDACKAQSLDTTGLRGVHVQRCKRRRQR